MEKLLAKSEMNTRGDSFEAQAFKFFGQSFFSVAFSKSETIFFFKVLNFYTSFCILESDNSYFNDVVWALLLKKLENN